MAVAFENHTPLALTPRSSRQPLLDDAGLHSSTSHERVRGRRAFQMACSKHTVSHNCIVDPGMDVGNDEAPTPFCKDTSERTQKDDYCGLSSLELSTVHDKNHRRGRRHICHSKYAVAKTPSTPSLASEVCSEESAQFHLGHRAHVHDNRWKEQMEKETIQEEGSPEPMGGVTSHHLARCHGRLGKDIGKRRFEHSYQRHSHEARAINDPGGEDIDDKKWGFLGPSKGKPTNGTNFQSDNLFCDRIEEKERHSKKHFKDRVDDAVHATDEIPIGVSTQIDLHTRGFLGKSKHNFGGMMQVSSDPIAHRSNEIFHERDQNDLSCYGLEHRGKRKFLVQNNLEAGCRHDLSRTEVKSMPTFRSMSVPVLERDLPPNSTPYWQDDLPESARAVKPELNFACTTGKEADRMKPPRSCIPVADSSWSCLTWTPRKVDDKSAARFVDGQDLIFGVGDAEHTEAEIRNAMGKHKRTFGNSHNKSEFRHAYDDQPQRKSEFIAIVNQHLAADVEDQNRKTERTIRWGNGYGRRKFVTKDHLGRDADDGDGIAYFSANGSKLGKVKHLLCDDHLDNPEADGTSFFLDAHGTKGQTVHAKNNKLFKKVVDHVDELMQCEVQSEDSNTLNVTGVRRKTDLIRPSSARRFPQKDFERATPRSATPRARSEAQLGLPDRPKWKK